MAEITARGLRFHVQTLGPAEAPCPVVFLHGLVMDNLSSFYFTLANPVAERARVVLYDLRGHGLSERPREGYTLDDMVSDLDALLIALRIEGEIDLVGHSFGGLLAIAFAARSPGRVRRMVLLEGHLGAKGWGDKMAETLALQGEERDQRIVSAFSTWLGRSSARKRSRLAETAKALVEGTTLIEDMRRSPPVQDGAIAGIESRVLAIYGVSSDLRPEAERVIQLLPHAELRLVEGATHSVLWEATADVRAMIVGWLGGDPRC